MYKKKRERERGREKEKKNYGKRLYYNNNRAYDTHEWHHFHININWTVYQSIYIFHYVCETHDIIIIILSFESH